MGTIKSLDYSSIYNANQVEYAAKSGNTANSQVKFGRENAEKVREIYTLQQQANEIGAAADFLQNMFNAGVSLHQTYEKVKTAEEASAAQEKTLDITNGLERAKTSIAENKGTIYNEDGSYSDEYQAAINEARDAINNSGFCYATRKAMEKNLDNYILEGRADYLKTDIETAWSNINTSRSKSLEGEINKSIVSGDTTGIESLVGSWNDLSPSQRQQVLTQALDAVDKGGMSKELNDTVDSKGFDDAVKLAEGWYKEGRITSDELDTWKAQAYNRDQRNQQYVTKEMTEIFSGVLEETGSVPEANKAAMDVISKLPKDQQKAQVESLKQLQFTNGFMAAHTDLYNNIETATPTEFDLVIDAAKKDSEGYFYGFPDLQQETIKALESAKQSVADGKSAAAAKEYQDQYKLLKTRVGYLDQALEQGKCNGPTYVNTLYSMWDEYPALKGSNEVGLLIDGKILDLANNTLGTESKEFAQRYAPLMDTLSAVGTETRALRAGIQAKVLDYFMDYGTKDGQVPVSDFMDKLNSEAFPGILKAANDAGNIKETLTDELDLSNLVSNLGIMNNGVLFYIDTRKTTDVNGVQSWATNKGQVRAITPEAEAAQATTYQQAEYVMEKVLPYIGMEGGTVNKESTRPISDGLMINDDYYDSYLPVVMVTSADKKSASFYTMEPDEYGNINIKKKDGDSWSNVLTVTQKGLTTDAQRREWNIFTGELTTSGVRTDMENLNEAKEATVVAVEQALADVGEGYTDTTPPGEIDHIAKLAKGLPNIEDASLDNLEDQIENLTGEEAELYDQLHNELIKELSSVAGSAASYNSFYFTYSDEYGMPILQEAYFQNEWPIAKQFFSQVQSQKTPLTTKKNKGAYMNTMITINDISEDVLKSYLVKNGVSEVRANEFIKEQAYASCLNSYTIDQARKVRAVVPSSATTADKRKIYASPESLGLTGTSITAGDLNSAVNKLISDGMSRQEAQSKMSEMQRLIKEGKTIESAFKEVFGK